MATNFSCNSGRDSWINCPSAATGPHHIARATPHLGPSLLCTGSQGPLVGNSLYHWILTAGFVQIAAGGRHPYLFASGDCAVISAEPRPSGVWAVAPGTHCYQLGSNLPRKISEALASAAEGAAAARQPSRCRLGMLGTLAGGTFSPALALEATNRPCIHGQF